MITSFSLKLKDGLQSSLYIQLVVWISCVDYIDLLHYLKILCKIVSRWLVFYNSNTSMHVLSNTSWPYEAVTACSSRAPVFIPDFFCGACVAHLVNFLCSVVILCLVCLRHVSCVTNVVNVSGLPIFFIAPLVFSNGYLHQNIMLINRNTGLKQLL